MSDTICEEPILSEPIKFLGATVLAFNSGLGLGSSPSTLQVTVVEDCQAEPPDSFRCNLAEDHEDYIGVGDPAYFTAGSFTFGGVITGWDVKKDTGGKVFTVRLEDPRTLLSNMVVVVDSYNGPPKEAANYVNVYHHLEQGLCSDFGLSFNTDQGTPYLKIMEALVEIDPYLCAPHHSIQGGGNSYKVEWNDFPGRVNNLPEFYRIQGPGVPLLELLTQACDMAGCEFYVYMEEQGGENVIRVGLIDLKNQPTSFLEVVNAYQGQATELSYGQELRNEKTKTMMIGDYVHYMSYVDRFYPYFGEDFINNEKIPVIPYGWDDFGFWISKSILELNTTLNAPFPSIGPFNISELDIRFAMSGYQSWIYWVFVNQASGTFNNAVRAMYPLVDMPGFRDIIRAIQGDPAAITSFGHWLDGAGRTNAGRISSDVAHNPTRGRANANKPEILEELEKVHSWLSGLGSTYYGKQYLTPFHEGMCYYLTDYSVNNGQGVFSSNPVDAGWVDPGIPVLGLGDPYLEAFKDDVGKLNGFAVFNNVGTIEPPSSPTVGFPEAGGNAGGGNLAGFCWVAREVYGVSDRWMLFREYLLERAPSWLRHTYGKYGERFALYIKNKPLIKFVIRKIMDTILYWDNRRG